MTTVRTRKKLIEVALPLEAINAASAREKSIRHGHPSTLHLWWARRPLAAARAVIFSQMVDDPSACPEEFPTEEEQDQERQRLHDLIKQLVLWENTTNETVLEAAREEIRKSWRRTCADNKDHPQAAELFDPEKLPAFHDPFAGGGALPLEAQRLGLEAYASDLNPVAVLINKAMIEIPPKFAGQPPVNPDDRKKMGSGVKWKGAAGLAADVRYYGKWMRDEAEKRIGHLYPKVLVTPEMVAERPDLKRYEGRDLTVIAWLWARTVKSPNPAFRDVDVPLISTYLLSTKPGKETYVEPVIEGRGYRFTVKVGKPRDAEAAKNGTKSGGSHTPFLCLMSSTAMPFEYLRSEAKGGRLGARMMAIVAEGDRGRVYLNPTAEMEKVAATAAPEWKPEVEISHWPGRTNVVEYGLTTFGDLFTDRQLVALTTFSDLVGEARERVKQDALVLPRKDLPDDPRGIDDGGTGAQAYADAVAVYLAFGVDRSSDFWSSLNIWANQPKNELVAHLFGRQAIPMAWDFAEANPFSSSGGNFTKNVEYVCEGVEYFPLQGIGHGFQADAAAATAGGRLVVISTDPPYYDNVGYADLSDYFYVWLRRALGSMFPTVFATVATPKTEELIASPYRHGGRDAAERFFVAAMTKAMHQVGRRGHPGAPITIYYAYKQAETTSELGTVQTGWETFLESLGAAGLAITGTWPIRTERTTGLKGGANMLASSIVLVCRALSASAASAMRTDYLQELTLALRDAIPKLTSGEVPPVDFGQSCIGPGMAVYTKYRSVTRQDGKPVTVGDALKDINAIVWNFMWERASSFDPRTRFCLDFFNSAVFEVTDFDTATKCARTHGVGIDTLEREHLLVAEAGKAWLVALKSYPVGVAGLERAFAGSAWEACLRLAATLQEEGEAATAALARELGEGVCARARELAVWLYTIADARKRPQDALAFNALDASWPEIQRLLASMDRGGQQGRFA